MRDRWDVVFGIAQQEPWTLGIAGHPNETVARAQMQETTERFEAQSFEL